MRFFFSVIALKIFISKRKENHIPNTNKGDKKRIQSTGTECWHQITSTSDGQIRVLERPSSVLKRWRGYRVCKPFVTYQSASSSSLIGKHNSQRLQASPNARKIRGDRSCRQRFPWGLRQVAHVHLQRDFRDVGRRDRFGMQEL